MPGILGIFSKQPLDSNVFEKMIKSVSHKDFYDLEKFVNDNCSLARVHLGIYDQEKQPIFNEEGTKCIFIDGKIYNSPFKSHPDDSDAKTVLKAFTEKGPSIFRYVDGAFTIVMYDITEQKLTIVNDRFGLRPLYYTETKEGFLFSSEIKAITSSKKVRIELNDKAVADFFAFGKVIGDKTFFKNIEVLPPASVFAYEGNNLSKYQYYRFTYQPDYSKSKEMIAEELVRVFNKAVEKRIDDTLSYGISVSGGLDCRVIIGSMMSKRKKAFLFSFGPFDCDEVKIAQKVAETAKMSFRPIEITADTILKNARDVIFLTDGLDSIGVGYLPYVYRFIRQEGIDVVFDGYALDLTLGGSYLNKKILRAINKEELMKLIYKKNTLFFNKELKELFKSDYYQKIGNYPKTSFNKEFEKIDEEHMANYSDMFFLLNHVRRWTLGGHILMRVYVENAVPTFDSDLMEVISKIPPEWRYRHQIYRLFLRKLTPELAKIEYNRTKMRADAPILLWTLGRLYESFKENLRKKVSFITKGKLVLKNPNSYVDFNYWLRKDKEWKGFVNEMLLSDNTKSRKYLNQQYIGEMIKRHEEGKENNGVKIMYLVSFELLLRIFFKSER